MVRVLEFKLAAGSTNDSFPAPDIYNVCSRFFFLNAIQQLDSCQLCDTVLIPEPPKPCGLSNLTASFVDGATARINRIYLVIRRFSDIKLTLVTEIRQREKVVDF